MSWSLKVCANLCRSGAEGEGVTFVLRRPGSTAGRERGQQQQLLFGSSSRKKLSTF